MKCIDSLWRADIGHGEEWKGAPGAQCPQFARGLTHFFVELRVLVATFGAQLATEVNLFAEELARRRIH